MAAPIRFPFQVGVSEVYGRVTRPVAEVQLRVGRTSWQPHILFVDSGADFSMVSGLTGVMLGFSRRPGETVRRVKGISGVIPVLMRRVAMKIGTYELDADVGWAQGDDVPLILGRRDVFDHFDVNIRQRESVTEFRWRG
jgi:hypothetical protein